MDFKTLGKSLRKRSRCRFGNDILPYIDKQMATFKNKWLVNRIRSGTTMLWSGWANGSGGGNLRPNFLEIIGRLFQIVALVSLRDQFVKFGQLRGFAVKVEMFFFVSVRAVNRQSEKCDLHCPSSFFEGSGQAASPFVSWNVSK